MKRALLILPLLLAVPAQAAPPRDVARYVERRSMCNHWAGEEAYDADRGRDINRAIRKLRCTALGRDERRLKQRYQSNPAVLRQIRKARDTYPD